MMLCKGGAIIFFRRSVVAGSGPR